MKRILAALLAVLMLSGALPAWAEVAAATTEDGSTLLEGIPGDPVPCTYDSFQRLLVKNMARYGFEVSLTEAVYSNGSWVHVLPGDGYWLLAKATGPEEDALVTQILVTGYPETAGDVLLFASIAMAVTAKCGKIGQGVLFLMAADENPEAYFDGEPYRFWYESGFDLTLGNRGLYVFASIQYQQPLETRVTYQPLGREDATFPMAENPVPMAQLAEAMDAYGTFLGLPPVAFSEPEDMGDGTWVCTADWAQCIVCACSSEKGGPVGAVVVVSYTGDTNYAWAAAVSVFMGISGIPKELIWPYTYLNGERGTWDDLCAMKPYAVENGVMVQCFVEDGSPVAHICGSGEASEHVRE